MNDVPLVSIICTTYNHENFIAQALEGFVMQKTNFPYEIIVHDDASTDRTADIVRDYETKYPELFVTIYQKENQFSKREKSIWADITFPLARGKYIALCEGDDYWTDPYKLQKQVEFLEGNSDLVICTHVVKEIDNNENFIRLLTPEILKDKYTYRDINISITLWTNSVLFRNILTCIPSWITKLPAGDFPLWLLLTKYGNIGYVDEQMSVYRNNNKGIHSSLSRTGKIKNALILVKTLKKHFGEDYKSYFIDLNNMYYRLLSNEIKELSGTEKYSEARKALFLMIKNNITFYKYDLPSYKELFDIIIGTKVWLLLMAIKGKRSFNQLFR